MKKLTLKIVFLSALVLLLAKGIFDPMFKKYNSFQESIEQFYTTENDSVDVLIFGSSHARNSYNTKIIDEALGLNSFSLASGGQKIIVTNSLIEDVLKDVKPKLVILDVFAGSLDYPKEPHQKSNQLQVIDNTKWTFNKIKLVSEIYNTNELPSAVSPLIRNHHEWHKANWIGEPQKLDSTRAFFNKGFSGSYTIIDDQERAKLIDYKLRKQNYLNIPKSEIDPSKLKDELIQVKKAISLCKKNGVELLLVSSPYFDAFYSSQASNFHFLVKEAAEKNGIRFLDFNTKFDQLGLKMDDFRDRSHVNLFGADKVTADLVNYLVDQNYFDFNNGNLEDKLNSLKSTFELKFEKKLDALILPKVPVSTISMYQNNAFTQIELDLANVNEIEQIISKRNFEIVATPFDKDQNLLEGDFKKRKREIFTFYSVKNLKVDGHNKVLIRIPKSKIQKFKNFRLFTFEKNKRQTSQKFIIDLPNLDLSKTIVSRFEKADNSSSIQAFNRLKSIYNKPYVFNDIIKTDEISYLPINKKNFTFLFKISPESKLDQFDKYLGYIRYYNGEIKDENKKVRSFPLTILENEGNKYIFARLTIFNSDISKFDVFFLNRETKKASKFFSTKEIKLNYNAD